MDPAGPADLEADVTAIDAVTIYVNGRDFSRKRTTAGSAGAGKASKKGESTTAPKLTQPMGAFAPILESSEPEDNALLRRLGYEQAVRVLGEAVASISSATHEAVFAKATGFLTQRMEGADIPILGAAGVSFGPEPSRLVPTVVLYAGLNLSDQEALFEQLVTYLRANCTSNVVYITGRERSDGAAIVAKFMDAARAAAKRGTPVDPPIPPMPPRSPEKKKPQKSNAKGAPGASVRAKLRARLKEIRYSDNPGRPIAAPAPSVTITLPSHGPVFPLLVIPDAQNLHPSVLECVTQALSHVNLPCGLLLGVCTTVESFRASLPLSVVSKLIIKPVFLKNPVVFVDSLLETLCVRGFLRAQLGHKPLQWLTQHMLRSNMSVQSFVSALRLCLLHYYSTAPLASLACLPPATSGGPIATDLISLKPPDVDPALWRGCASLVASIPEEMIDIAMALPSMKAPPPPPAATSKKRGSSSLSSASSRLPLCSALYAIESQRILWPAALRCVQATLFATVASTEISTAAAGADGGDTGGDGDDRMTAYSLRRLHFDVLEARTSGASLIGPISTAQQKLRELPMETLKALVLQWQKIFLNCNDESGLVPSDTVLNVAPDVVMDPLDTILEAISGGGGKPSAAEPAAEASPKGPALPIGSLKRRQAVLQTVAAPRGSKDPVWFVRDSASKWLNTLAQHCLVLPSQLPLHEAVYYDHISSLRRCLDPSPRLTVMQAIGGPKAYLPCPTDCCPKDHSDGGGNTPDITRAFRIYEGSGRLINLFDWYSAFRESIIGPEAAASPEPAKPVGGKPGGKKAPLPPLPDVRGEEEEAVIKARFLQCVKEMRWMGFIKPAGRKQDVVGRVVYSMDTW